MYNRQEGPRKGLAGRAMGPVSVFARTLQDMQRDRGRNELRQPDAEALQKALVQLRHPGKPVCRRAGGRPLETSPQAQYDVSCLLGPQIGGTAARPSRR